VQHDVKEYPTAGHSFLNDEPHETNPLMGLLLEQVLHAGPDPAAAADAWDRIDAFFSLHLG
jgi:carboxymethylenebutenolidase